MKKISYLLPLLLFACTHAVKSPIAVKDTIAPKQDTITKDTVVKAKQTNKLVDDNDTVNISTVPGDPLKYTKGELRDIKAQYPEFSAEFIDPPDVTYGKSECYDHKADRDLIGCEACKDGYYSLYAYFLKTHFRGEKHAIKRKTLVRLYRDINEIFGKLKYGGTYFGHQYTRILGYAEYSVYVYDYGLKNDELKKYDIREQKKLYIGLLKQHIRNEVDNDPR